ncbi:MAG: hypothetical protein HKN33_00640, partial [Pyrinomonadaceae bacterium]|nr:hypothetical protein [Pyrinomonadaceae bacterium]
GLLSTRIENGSYGPRYGELQLHFYAHDRNGTNHLKTERLEFAPVGVEMSKEMPWLSRFDSEQNVYVIAEVKRGRRGWNYPPPFTISKATPLLISDK